MWKRPQINHTERRHDCNSVEHLQITSAEDRQYQYQHLYLKRLLSPLCLCVEGILRPRLNPPLCAASVRSVSAQWRGVGGLRKRPVDLERSQGQSGFYPGLSYALLTVTGSANSLWPGAEANGGTITLGTVESRWPKSGLCPCGCKFSRAHTYTHTCNISADWYKTQNLTVLTPFHKLFPLCLPWNHFEKGKIILFPTLWHFHMYTFYSLSASFSFSSKLLDVYTEWNTQTNFWIPADTPGTFNLREHYYNLKKPLWVWITFGYTTVCNSWALVNQYVSLTSLTG